MAKKVKKAVAKAKEVVTRKTAGARKRTKKVSKKLFKVKKGKNLIKGLASVAVNAGIQKGMNSVFEGRIKKSDFTKDGVFNEKAYNEAVEQQKTIHGAANVGLWLVGAANALPKDYISSEYLEINALERGINTFVSKNDKKRIEKNPKAKPNAPYFQGVDDDLLIESADEDYVMLEATDDEAYAMLEAADLIENAELEEAFIEDYEDEDLIEDYEDEDVVFLEETSSDDDEDVKIEYEVEVPFGFEGMNSPVPGIEEEN